ncbi:hypothetical protein EDB80DRAFT_879911 [Ilyonectria destructans]|nr:hypothetical protein EDB80DRAFT_879911 [Ilyonectria destructans]
MTMTLHTAQRFGPSLNYDSSAPAQPPTFSNPWSSTSSPPQPAPPGGGLFVGNHQALNPNMMAGKRPHSGRASTSSASSIASYGSMPVANTSAGSLSPSPSMVGIYEHQDLLNVPQDLLSISRSQTTSAAYGDATYTTSASPVNAHFAPTSVAPYEAMGYAHPPVRPPHFTLAPHADHARRFSQHSLPHDDRRSFADALDASRGMLAMSQETPRNIYGAQSDRSSVDSYGFPSTHSTSSSISSTDNFSSYYGDSVSDYSIAGSDIESVNSRVLHRSQELMASQIPPAPQSMIGQFSSKVSSSTQKKHKCKVCDKRFARPSSLQTHMYSHTGEKPFVCEVEGCGRHFSIVSNLRRHRKVHRGDSRSEAGSEDHHSD